MPDNTKRQLFYTLISEKGRALLDLDYIPGFSTFPFDEEQKFHGISVEVTRDKVSIIRWHETSIDLCFFDAKGEKHWFSFSIDCLRAISAPGVSIILERPIMKNVQPVYDGFKGKVVSLDLYKMKKVQGK